jgi:type II secretory pathway component PulJ
MKKIQKQQGFSLIEFLMYMGIFSLLLISLFQMFTSILDNQAESETTASVSEDGKFLIARLSYDIQQASEITTPATIGSSGNSLQLTIGGTSYSYTINNGNLVLTNTAETNAPLNGYDTTVSNLSFTRLGNSNGKNVITVAFTVTSRITKQSGPESQTFQTTIGTR